MVLTSIHVGDGADIVSIPDCLEKTLLSRMGIIAGIKVICVGKMYKGAIVIATKRQEVAIGHELAKKIIIKKTNERDVILQ